MPDGEARGRPVERHARGEAADVLRRFAARLRGALRRTRWQILAFLVLHLCAVLAGAVMVHRGDAFALARRDAIVGAARASNPATRAFAAGDRPRAALVDAGENLLRGALPLTVAGPSVVVPYALAAYRGWVGGVVAVDGQHRSRLREPRRAAYYLVTLLLQLVPYSVAGGAGVNIGWTALRARGWPAGLTWLGFPREPILDAAVLYALIVPLFLLASAWVFGCPWV
jgi:hypothetical protein